MTGDSMKDERITGSKDMLRTEAADPVSEIRYSADLSLWVIWGVIMFLAITVLPFVVRSHDVVRAIANMCGFDLG